MTARRIEFLAIGDELLDGRVTDTNSVRCAAELRELGLGLDRRTTVKDDLGTIVDACRQAIARGATLCVVSGGLGPTTDDITAEALAALAGVSLERDLEHVAAIESRLRRLGREPTDNQRRQADRPQGARSIPNDVGTAPGFALLTGGCDFVSLPGVPAEFDPMLERAVLSQLRDSAAGLVRRRVLCTFGLFEAEVDSRLAGFEDLFPRTRVGYRAKFPEVHVSLATAGNHVAELDAAEAEVRQRLGASVFGANSVTLPEAVVNLLARSGETVATAESCTGGRVADALTDIPGASAVFRGTVVAYTDAVKQELLGVRAKTLTDHTAVSKETACEMALGVRERLGANYGISTTGIAGPASDADLAPVGQLHIALATGEDVIHRQLQLPLDRRRFKLAAAYAALDLLRRSRLSR